jgi:hypothetical protein
MAIDPGTWIQFHLDVDHFNRRLTAFAAAHRRAADAVVQDVAGKVLRDTQDGWPVDSGDSRAAWTEPIRVGPAAYQLRNPLVYAKVIEFGGWPSPAEKTVAFGPVVLPGSFPINQGVYARQVPAAPLRRALSKHYGEMLAQMAEAHQTAWGH